MNIVTGAIGSDAFLRIETCTLHVTGVKTLALEPSKPLFQAANTTHCLVKRALQATAYLVKIPLQKSDRNYKLIYIYLEGPKLLTDFLDTSIKAGIVEVDFLVQPFY